MDKIRNDNSGLTIVEVLVSIAIIGIVFMVIMKSFMSSADMNAKAHKSQQATAVAQKIMEEFKANSLSTISTNFATPISTKVVYPVGMTAEEKKKYPVEVFTSYTYQKLSVAAEDGTKYDVVVELDPTDYSNTTVSGAAASEANTKEIGKIEGVDDLKNAVIASEINRYDGAIPETFLNLLDSTQANALGSTKAIRLAAILTGIRKEIKINLNTSGSQIQAACVVTYQYMGLSQSYKVYNGTFELVGNGSGSDFKWLSGGNIYVVATPFTQYDTISIVNSGYTCVAESNKELNLYLVRGTQSSYTSAQWSKMYNLYSVIINGSSTFMNRATGVAAPDSGKMLGVSSMNIISNMKGVQSATVIGNQTEDIAGKDASVYKDFNIKLRCMKMVVKLYEPGTLALPAAQWEARKQVEVTSTKEIN